VEKMIVHEIKCWPKYFKDLESGIKTFEIRKDDRYYQVGHFLEVREWEPIKRIYTGNKLSCEITYKLNDCKFLQPGYCALGIEVIEND
jgi:hypothetical protein